MWRRERRRPWGKEFCGLAPDNLLDSHVQLKGAYIVRLPPRRCEPAVYAVCQTPTKKKSTWASSGLTVSAFRLHRQDPARRDPSTTIQRGRPLNRETAGPSTPSGLTRRGPRVGRPTVHRDGAAASYILRPGACSVVKMIQGVIPPY